MAFGRPSRSYANVEHDVEGLSGAGSAPFSSRRQEGGFKTYRAPLAEHSRRIDPALPHALQSSRARKEAAAAGARAELDHILESGYKPSSRSVYNGHETNGESSSMARHRTAGGLQAERERRSTGGASLRSTVSVGNFRAGGNGGKRAVFVDADGRSHDQDYDPFAKHSQMSRKQSRRRSAFGSDRHGHGQGGSGSESGGSSASNSEAAGPTSSSATGLGGGSRRSMDAGREEEETRRRAEAERRRMEEQPGAALAKRRSIISERSGRGTPSILSNDDGDRRTVQSSIYSANGHGHGYGYGQYGGGGGRRSAAGYHPSPLSPTFSAADQPVSAPAGRARTNTTSDGGDAGYGYGPDGEETPVKSTENTLAPPMSPPLPPPPSPGYAHLRSKSPQPPKEPARAKVEIKRDGSRKVTGFDAPTSPMPPPALPAPSIPNQQLDVPPSAKSAGSRGSRGSSDRERERAGSALGVRDGVRERFSAEGSFTDSQSIMSAQRRARPAERPREESFPETPAQAKRREERERRAGRLGSRAASGATMGQAGAGPSRLAIDTSLAASTRLLPEIQIVEDDDPRIVFNPEGRTTRVQKTHDHVIRAPFALALDAQAQGSGSGSGRPGSVRSQQRERERDRADSPATAGGAGGSLGMARPSSVRSSPFSNVGSGGAIEDAGGYLPSRWAKGDTQLRTTDTEREMYRPKEWGGRKGELGGRPEEWHPDLKDQIKRTWKDVQTNARFSLFRAKAKMGRM